MTSNNKDAFVEASSENLVSIATQLLTKYEEILMIQRNLYLNEEMVSNIKPHSMPLNFDQWVMI